MPRGGARPGAGRKPKDAALAKLHGSQRTSVVRFPSAPQKSAAVAQTAAGPVNCPEELDYAAKAVWANLAPHALAAGTLTVGTSASFAMLCRQVVLEKALSLGRDAGLASHRGMMQRVEAGFVRFALVPMGKPMARPAEADADPFAEFG